MSKKLYETEVCILDLFDVINGCVSVKLVNAEDSKRLDDKQFWLNLKVVCDVYLEHIEKNGEINIDSKQPLALIDLI